MPLLFYFPLIMWAGLVTIAQEDARVAATIRAHARR